MAYRLHLFQSKNEVTELNARSSVMDLVSGYGFARQGYPVRGLFSIPFVGLNSMVSRCIISMEK